MLAAKIQPGDVNDQIDWLALLESASLFLET